MAQDRFALLLVASFAALAVVLAAVGIYGALSYSVSRRSREMGIRMALGATTGAVRAMIVRDGGRLAFAGVGMALSPRSQRAPAAVDVVGVSATTRVQPPPRCSPSSL